MRYASSMLVIWWVVAALGAGAARADPTPDCPLYGPDSLGGCLTEPLLTAPAGPRGLSLTSTPNGALVSEGGKVLGATPLRLSVRDLRPGRHQLTVRHHDYVTETVTVVIDARKLTTHAVTLVAKPTMELLRIPPRYHGAYVSIDDRLVGTLEASGFSIAVEPGHHVVKVDKENFEPWTYEGDFRAGGAVAEPIVLKAKVGRLIVGGDSTAASTGVKVYLDPDPQGASDGTLLGITPVDARDVPAGKHVVVLRVHDVVAETVIIDVPASGEVSVPVMPRGLASRFHAPWSDDRDVDLADATEACATYGSAVHCMVAGHAAARTDRKEAADLYDRACVDENGPACYAAGYLWKQMGDERGILRLSTACRWGEMAACWAFHVPLNVLPDPAKDPGEWELFIRREDISGSGGKRERRIEVHAQFLGGVGPDASTPILNELAFRGSFDVVSWLAAELSAGVRFRSLAQIDDATQQSDWTTNVGYGVELGGRLRYDPWSRFGLRIAGRATTYFQGVDGVSTIATLSARIGTHIVEVGTILDRVPVRYLDVDAFGGDYRVEKVETRLIPVVRYSYVFMDQRM